MACMAILYMAEPLWSSCSVDDYRVGATKVVLP